MKRICNIDNMRPIEVDKTTPQPSVFGIADPTPPVSMRLGIEYPSYEIFTEITNYRLFLSTIRGLLC